MKMGKASGVQIAFFTFALLLLLVPVASFLQRLHDWRPETWTLVKMALPFVVMGAVLLGFPQLKRACAAELSRPIPRHRRREVMLVAATAITIGFAHAGAWVLWWWLLEGPVAVEQRLRLYVPSHAAEMARLAAPAEWIRNLLLASVIAPVIEELVFRGFLYRAWEARWGWVISTLLTSALFAAYHANALPSFTMSVLCVCLYRRTGTLWAPIVAHATHNLLAFYPLLGQFIFPRSDPPSGDIGAWGFQLACLLFVPIALAAYVWMARKPAPRDLVSRIEAHEPLPQ